MRRQCHACMLSDGWKSSLPLTLSEHPLIEPTVAFINLKSEIR